MRPDVALVGWGRAAVLLVLVVSALDWVGWATGVEELTRIVASWPQMTPWTALWLAALGVSILMLSYGSRPGLRWAGRVLAAVVGFGAVIVLAEYAIGRHFGVDELWFGEAVRELQGTWPGRPSPQTALGTIFLSVVVALPRMTRPRARMAFSVCVLAALAIPGVAVLAYVFGASGLVALSDSTGIAIATALCLLLLGVGALLLRRDGVLRAWLLSGPNRRALLRLGTVVATFPIVVGLSWRILIAVGIGEREGLIFSTTVGTVIVGATALHYTQRVADLAQRLQETTDQQTAELERAAAYMASIMPSDLNGRVTVTSRYLPSRELGGDCFDYHWIGDHLVIYLIDVSGHGVEPALLAVSAHNLLRSGSISTETLLDPKAVLTELNTLFRMEQHNDHYFTVWYGVYQASTSTLRYASAGSPPALAFTANAEKVLVVTELSTPAAPVGMFAETQFASCVFRVPRACRILVHSDGASELQLPNGQQLTPSEFQDLTAELATTPDWSLDALIQELRAVTPTGDFDDDCSMILLAFD